jgi:hypothetical protein
MAPHMYRLLGRYNTAVSTGKERKSKRAVTVKALHGSAFLEHNERAIREGAQSLVDRICREQKEHDEHFVDVIYCVLRILSMAILCRAALSDNSFGCADSSTDSTPQQHSVSRVLSAIDFPASEIMRCMTRDVPNPAS